MAPYCNSSKYYLNTATLLVTNYLETLKMLNDQFLDDLWGVLDVGVDRVEYLP